jgi:DNA replication initiation complex subunit (GINS family)
MSDEQPFDLEELTPEERKLYDAVMAEQTLEDVRKRVEESRKNSKGLFSPDDPSPEAEAARRRGRITFQAIADRGRRAQRARMRQALLGGEKAQELQRFLKNQES